MGGLTISEDGGLDELREFMPKRARNSTISMPILSISLACSATTDCKYAIWPDSSKEGAPGLVEGSSAGIPNVTRAEFPGGGRCSQGT